MSLQKAHTEVIGFGTLHPGYANWEAELQRIKAAGLRGLKLHPDFQGFWLNDPRLLPIFEAAQKDFIFEIHIGDNISPEKNPSCPYKLAAILDAFPGLNIIAAHLGGYRMWEHAMKILGGRRRENLWFDTSSVTPFVTPEELRALLAAFPQERLLFGTDWPLYDPEEELERLPTHGRAGRCPVGGGHEQRRTAFRGPGPGPGVNGECPELKDGQSTPLTGRPLCG